MPTIDSFTATLDATLRAWELVQVRDIEGDDGAVVEEGRGCFVSVRYARDNNLDFKDEETVRRVIDEHGGDWVRLLPFVDFANPLPRIGFNGC